MVAVFSDAWRYGRYWQSPLPWLAQWPYSMHREQQRLWWYSLHLVYGCHCINYMICTSLCLEVGHGVMDSNYRAHASIKSITCSVQRWVCFQCVVEFLWPGQWGRSSPPLCLELHSLARQWIASCPGPLRGRGRSLGTRLGSEVNLLHNSVLVISWLQSCIHV